MAYWVRLCLKSQATVQYTRTYIHLLERKKTSLYFFFLGQQKCGAQSCESWPCTDYSLCVWFGQIYFLDIGFLLWQQRRETRSSWTPSSSQFCEYPGRGALDTQIRPNEKEPKLVVTAWPHPLAECLLWLSMCNNQTQTTMQAQQVPPRFPCLVIAFTKCFR